MHNWRYYEPALRAGIVGSEVYHRDPFTVVVAKFNLGKLSGKPNDSITTGVGVTKRNRYARSYDENNPKTGATIATSRALKDIFRSLQGDSIPHLESFMNKYSSTVEIYVEEERER